MCRSGEMKRGTASPRLFCERELANIGKVIHKYRKDRKSLWIVEGMSWEHVAVLVSASIKENCGRSRPIPLGISKLKLHEVTFLVTERCDSMGVTEHIWSSEDGLYHWSMLLLYQLTSNICACLIAPVPEGKFTDVVPRLSPNFHLFLFTQFYHLSFIPNIPVLLTAKVSSVMLQDIRMTFSCCVTKYIINRPLIALNSGLLWNISYWKAQFLAFSHGFLELTPW